MGLRDAPPKNCLRPTPYATHWIHLLRRGHPVDPRQYPGTPKWAPVPHPKSFGGGENGVGDQNGGRVSLPKLFGCGGGSWPPSGMELEAGAIVGSTCDHM